MAKCRVWWDAGVLAYRAQFPYKPQIVDFLKKQIPHSDRSWDETSKTWTFTENYLDDTVKFMRLIFGDQEVACVTRQQFEASQQPRSNISVRSLDAKDALLARFMKSIPYESAKAAYRHAAMFLHPDRNKDPEAMSKMSEVNALWSKIEKEVYGQ